MQVLAIPSALCNQPPSSDIGVPKASLIFALGRLSGRAGFSIGNKDMAMTQKRALGLDFGTTNTVMALSDGGGDSRSMRFTSSAGTDDSMRTALSFMKDAGLGAAALHVEAGHAAIRQFIDNAGDCRFLQSIKTFAASPLFQGTLIFAKRQSFEDLMDVFLRKLKTYAGEVAR